MIISHKYKYIFLKTNKTAGTSIEIALSKHCGPNDIITPISTEDEKIRRTLGYRGPQNYHSPLDDYQVRDGGPPLSEGKKNNLKYYNHISAARVRINLGEEIWNRYFKFCFERNPWDRVISHYYWINKGESRPSIIEHLERNGHLLKSRGYGLYTIDGEVAVDKICRFEDIKEELESIRLQLQIPEKLELPRAKSSFRKDKRDYSEVLSKEESKKIADLFENEIELMSYEF